MTFQIPLLKSILENPVGYTLVVEGMKIGKMIHFDYIFFSRGRLKPPTTAQILDFGPCLGPKTVRWLRSWFQGFNGWVQNIKNSQQKWWFIINLMHFLQVFCFFFALPLSLSLFFFSALSFSRSPYLLNRCIWKCSSWCFTVELHLESENLLLVSGRVSIIWAATKPLWHSLMLLAKIIKGQSKT